MLQIIGWIVWSAVALLAILGVLACRHKAGSPGGFAQAAAAGVTPAWLSAIAILFLVFGWNKLHILWVAVATCFLVPFLADRKIPVLYHIMLHVAAAFLRVAFAGIKLRPPAKIEDAKGADEDDEDQETGGERMERYERIREVGRELTAKIMKHVPKFALRQAARDLGMVGRGGILIFDSEEEMSILMDRYFYDIYWEGKNLVGHFMASEDYGHLTKEEQAIVQGMATAYYSLFEVVGIDLFEATVELEDLLGDGTYRIMDQSMSLTFQEGCLMAAHIQQVEGIYMTSGVALPFYREQKEALLERFRPKEALARKGKKRKQRRGFQRSDYSAYFFKQHKKIGGIEFRTAGADEMDVDEEEE